MRLLEVTVYAPTRCSACGAIHTRGRMLSVPADYRLAFCLVLCAVDYSLGKRFPTEGSDATLADEDNPRAP